MSTKDDVRQEYEDLKNHFRNTNFEDFKAGGWFPQFVKWMLEEYARKVDAEYIRRKYPGAGSRNQATKAISLASKHAMIAGGMSAAAVTAMELTLPTPGAPLAIGGIGTAIMADIAFNTRLQLRTVYDLSVIYRAPLSLDDAEDCYLIFLTALGLKLSEMAGGVVKAVGPKVIQYNIRKLLRSGVRRFLIEIVKRIAGTAIARKLTERALLRLLVPGVGIPLSAGANYAFTKKILHAAEEQMRRRGSIIEPLLKLYKSDRSVPRELVIQGLIVVMEAPGREGWDEDQMNALRHTQTFLSLTDEQIAALEDWFERSAAQFTKTLPPLPAEARVAFLEYLTRVAALGQSEDDGHYVRALQEIATGLGSSFDPENLKKARKAVA